MLKKFYSVKEASKILSVSTNTIYKYLDAGSLQGKRFNDRGRFKIPYSEIEPYLARETSAEATESTEVNEISEDITEKTQKTPQIVKKDGSNLAFFESFGIPLMGLLVIYLLWSFGRSAAVSQPSLITNVKNAILGYSDRTFSKFGNLVYQAVPGFPGNGEATAVAQKPSNEAQPVSQNDIVNNSMIGFVSGEKTPDLNYKIADTEGRTNDLYANVQVISSNAQRLLGKSKTLTSAELNSETEKMSQFLGTIFAEISWLGENWNFSSIESSRRAASQINYLLSSLTSQSLAAFTKPDLEDLDNLVIETDALLEAIGNPSDTLTQTTIFGGVKEVKALAQTLDAKTGEINKILGSWDSYTTSEKENTVKLALSESLSINNLSNVEESVFSKLAVTGTDAELKNSLLSIKAVLEANKTHLTQKAGDPLVAPWLDSDGNVKILAINPSSLISQKVVIKYYLPEGIGKERVTQIDGGLTLSLDSQKNQYYVEGSPTLPAGGIKTIGLKFVSEKPLAKVVTPVEPITVPATTVKQIVSLPENPVPDVGQVAGIATSNYLPQSIVIWGSIVAIFVLGLVFWVINLKSMFGRGRKIHSTAVESKEVSVLLPTDKLNAVSGVSARGHSRVSFSLPRMEFRAIKKAIASIIRVFSRVMTSIKKFFINVFHAIKKFFAGIASAVRKIPVTIKTGLVAILVSTTTFFSKRLTSIKKFFTDTISAIRKIPLAIKTGLLAILTSIVAFFSKLLSSIKNFFVSMVKGVAGLVVSFIASLKRGFLAVFHAIKTFFLGLISAVRKVIVSIKMGILAILTSIVAFFLKILTSIKNFFISLVTGFIKLIVSFIASLKRGFLAIIHAIKTFFLGLISAVRKVIISIKTGILAILTSIVAFFLKVVTSVKNFFTSLVTGVIKLTISVVNSFGRGFGAFKRAIKTFFVNVTFAIKAFIVNIASAIVKTIISIKKAILGMIISVKTFFLKILSLTLKLVFSIITGLVNFVTRVITSVKKGIDAVVNAVITFIANIISIVTKAIISVITALRKIAVSITTFFLKILSKVVRAVAYAIRRILRILTSVAKFTDLTLNQMDFKAPAVHKPHSNYRNTATFLLVGVISATISGVLAFKFIPLI